MSRLDTSKQCVFTMCFKGVESFDPDPLKYLVVWFEFGFLVSYLNHSPLPELLAMPSLPVSAELGSDLRRIGRPQLVIFHNFVLRLGDPGPVLIAPDLQHAVFLVPALRKQLR